MCYRPIRIRTKRLFPRTGIDKSYMYVPCGHCPQCRQQSISDWYVRLSYESDYYRSIGGAVYFVTCTFNNYSVPRFDYSRVKCLSEYNCDIDLSCYDGQLCFGKDDVQQFINHLRALLVEEGIKDGVKYFLVSELGTDANKTHRPHYHIVFFLPVPIDNSHFLGLVNYAWSDRIKIEDYPEFRVDSYELNKQFCYGYYYQNKYVIVRPNNGCAGVTYAKRRGFCNYSKDNNGVSRPRLLGNLGLKYLLKYLYKDDLFMSSSFARDVNEFLKFLPPLRELEFKLRDFNFNPKTGEYLNNTSEYTDEQCLDLYDKIQAIRYLKNCLPFHLQSKGLGVSLKDRYEKTQDFTDIINHNKIAVNGDKEKYYVPQYVVRKLCYKVVTVEELKPFTPDPRVSVLTEQGHKILLACYKFKLEQKKDFYEYALSDKMISRLHSCPYELWHDIDISYLRNFYSQNKDLISVYDTVFQDLFTSASRNIYRYTSDELIRLAESIFNLKLDTHNLLAVCDISDYPVALDLFHPFGSDVSDDMESILFNKLPQFSGFDDFLDSIRKLSNIVYERYYDTKHKEYLNNIMTRKVHSHQVYNH